VKESLRWRKSGKLWKNGTGKKQKDIKSEKQTKQPIEDGSVVQERLNWHVAWRDDTKVGQALYAGETIEEMYQLSDAGLLDEFFVFLFKEGKHPWHLLNFPKRTKAAVVVHCHLTLLVMG